MSELLPFVVAGLVTGSVYGLAGMGLVLTYRTSGVLNFGHGALAAAGAFIFYTLYDTLRIPWPLAVVVTLAVFVCVIGVVLERVTASLSRAPDVLLVVVAVGIALGTEGILFWRYGNVARFLPDFLPTSGFRAGGVFVTWSQVIALTVASGSAVGLYVFLHRTRMGIAMRAVVDNPPLLSLSGQSPRRVRTAAWAIGSAFAALSGILLAPTLGLDATLLTLLVIQALGACAIGRFSSLPLTFVGGLVVGVSASVATRYLTTSPWSSIPPTIPFLVLVVVLLVTPTDRLPARARRAASLDVVDGARMRAPRAVLTVLGLAALLVLPARVGSYQPVWTSGLIAVLIFLSLSLLVWTSGQISLCHAAFLAIGAASMGHLMGDWHLPWGVALVLAALLAVPVGAAVALPAIRLSGIYLALATLGFGFLMQNLVYSTSLMFGSGAAPTRVNRPVLGVIDGTSERTFYYLVLCIVVVAVFSVTLLVRGRLGRLLHAMAEVPTMLSTHGLNVNVSRLIVFCLSAFLAGLAGALQVTQFGSASGDTFGPIQSLMYLAVLCVAGTRLVRSAVVAAALLAVVPSYAASQDFSAFANDADRQLLIFGLVAIVAGVLIATRVEVKAWLVERAATGRERMQRRRREWRHDARLPARRNGPSVELVQR